MGETAEILDFPVTSGNAAYQESRVTPEGGSGIWHITKAYDVQDIIKLAYNLNDVKRILRETNKLINELEDKLTVPAENEGLLKFRHLLDTRHVFNELKELLYLEPDWDGYGANPISKLAFIKANQFLINIGNKATFFEAFPMPDGSVGLEIHKDKNDELLLSFSPEGKAAYVVAYEDEVHRGMGIKDICKNMPSPVKDYLYERN